MISPQNEFLDLLSLPLTIFRQDQPRIKNKVAIVSQIAPLQSCRVTQFEKKHALSVPKNPGRRGLYKTILVHGSCRGRPFFGRAAVCSRQNQGESQDHLALD
jgi:hypothetical protein